MRTENQDDKKRIRTKNIPGDYWIYGWLNMWTDGRTDGRKPMVEQLVNWMNVWLIGRMDGQMNRWL